MNEWYKIVQMIIDEIDVCIKEQRDEEFTLKYVAQKLGYSDMKRKTV